MKLNLYLTAILTILLTPAARSGEMLPPNSRLAIIGDSITEQKLYSKYMETYLIACAGRPDIEVFQYGWGGERAEGFAARLVNDLTPFKPTVATTCYGMNDGQYRPYTEEIGRPYEANMRKVISGLQKLGVRTVVVGSPGAVDTKFFKSQSFAPLSGAEGYNRNLAALRDIDARLAQEFSQPFADVHRPMVETMAKAKEGFGEDYDVCGRDGVHPGPNGQLIMAYAFLRALGVDGQIAAIDTDLTGSTTGSAGHKVLSAQAGKVELESSRYPFCLEGDQRSPSTRSITTLFPFNQELNRFTLKVSNLSAPRARVNWEGQEKEFTREQLAQGVNLVSQFAQTPFDAAFRRVMDAVGIKQNFETSAIKSMITHFRGFSREAGEDAELAKAFAAVAARLMARQHELSTLARQALKPVKHTISITPVS